ncbi:hypothetical protein TNCV_230811 [Trichonephila clavipes]|nr:hypothetical protein TNCV_230811 [Trichonephila clavipes]
MKAIDSEPRNFKQWSSDEDDTRVDTPVSNNLESGFGIYYLNFISYGVEKRHNGSTRDEVMLYIFPYFMMYLQECKIRVFFSPPTHKSIVPIAAINAVQSLVSELFPSKLLKKSI